MRPKTNRLLMLLISAMLASCASQTERSSSGGGAEQAQAPAPTPAPAPAPAYQPQSESVQFVDRPLEEPPPPPPAKVAKAPEKPKTTYEVEPDEELGVLGGSPDESGTLEDAEEDLAAMDSAAGEPEEELGVLGTEADESGTMQDAEEDLVAMDDTAGEPDEELGVLGTQSDESGTVQDAEEDVAAMDSVADEPEEEADEPAEVGDEPAEVADEPVQVADRPAVVADKPAVVADKPAQVADKPVARAPVRVSFEAEPLFSFDKSVIRSDQRSKLDAFVASLEGTQYDSIDVIGHADHIGTAQYNLDLSLRRANAVKTYLVRQGVPTAKINAEGRGESEPVTAGTCRAQRGKALIACLEPDRRVDVSVTATKPAS